MIKFTVAKPPKIQSLTFIVLILGFIFNLLSCNSDNSNKQTVDDRGFKNIETSDNDKRLALVIGNSDYKSGNKLKNPVNDANLMAETLKKLGFEVIIKTDATKQSIEQGVREFSKKLPDFNIALFYYAGHGVQVDGMNYLLPVDANLNAKEDCKYEAIAVNFVVEEFEKYPNNTNIVILDACRNNPFRSWSRGNEKGFKAIAPTSGTIIAFATSEGSTASDGSGVNGLFTQELVKQMQISQSLETVFKKTRTEVENLSGGGQSPQEWSKLKGEFYFTKQVNVQNNAKQDDMVLNQGTNAFSSISIDTEIAGDLYVDGKKIGTLNANSTGNVLNKIAIGSHTIEIKGVENYTANIVVETGNTKSITVKSQVESIISNVKKENTKKITSSTNNNMGTFTDTRTNKIYKCVKIGNQTWMAENLAYEPHSGKYWAYNNDQSNVAKYGYLYDWETANKVAPTGWHLPSDVEWTQLIDYLGGISVAGGKMKEKGTIHWLKPNIGADNSSGFTAMPAGMRHDKTDLFLDMGHNSYFWSSTKNTGKWRQFCKGIELSDSLRNAVDNGFFPVDAVSVRCIKD